MKSAPILVFIVASVATSRAQNVQRASDNLTAQDGNSSSEGGEEGVAIAGRPFSGIAVTMRASILSGSYGSPQVIRSVFYRDSLGRRRVEQKAGGSDPWSSETSDVKIEISDPVAGVAYFLDTATHTGFRVKLRRVMPLGTDRKMSGAAAQVTSTSLGTQTILGLECTGTQKSRTILTGVSRSLQTSTISIQQWYSADLKMIVKRTLTDPRGKIDFQFESLSRASPDPSLFLPPSGFTIVDKSSAPRSGR